MTTNTYAIRWDNSIFNGYKPLQLRRGALSQLGQYIPNDGELIYSSSTRQLFVGDNVTPGGILVTGGGGGGNLDFGSITEPAGFTLDLGSI